MSQTDLLHTYADLPPRFFSRVAPTRVAKPRLIQFNRALAAELGLHLDPAPEVLAEIFSGNSPLTGSVPIAMAYAGHQFGQFVPQLGDGRAILLGETRGVLGKLRDIQLKGAGRTPYSRAGDGRAAVGPVLREYVVGEAMHALGIPATRALAAVSTGEIVFRDGPLPGAVLTRVAASHVRVGTFQFFAARRDDEGVKLLADYVIERHYPELRGAANPYLELLGAVVGAQARLVAAWMNVGFIHGVMNTDNMAVSGETIDFGPCAFLDTYDPDTVFSSIDSMGRYAYKRQPVAAMWNLARFGETLLPLIDSDSERAIRLATDVVGDFAVAFDRHWLAGMRRKLGFFTEEEDDGTLIRAFLDSLQKGGADFTLAFRQLSESAGQEAVATDSSDWIRTWRARLAREPHAPAEHALRMRQANPAFIPRNHRIEQAIAAAIERDDYAPFEELNQVLSRPYEDQPQFAAYAAAPQPEERVMQTFCGT